MSVVLRMIWPRKGCNEAANLSAAEGEALQAEKPV